MNLFWRNLSILGITCSSFFVSCRSNPDIVPAQEKDFCSSIHNSDTATLAYNLKPIAAQMKEKTAAYVLEDGGGSLITRAWLCEHATKSIDIQYFIFSTDNVGLIACDYLVRVADRGVQVRIIVDDIMVEAIRFLAGYGCFCDGLIRCIFTRYFWIRFICKMKDELCRLYLLLCFFRLYFFV